MRLLSHPRPMEAKPLNAAQRRTGAPPPYRASTGGAGSIYQDSVTFGSSRSGGTTPPEESRTPVKMSLPEGFWKRLQAAADKRQITVEEYLQQTLPHLTESLPEKEILAPVTDTVMGSNRGKPVKTEVTTLFGPEQIFDKYLEYLNKTEHYGQLSMFNFENESVAGGRGSDGADANPAWKKQQQILKLIERKAAKGVRFQFILDNSLQRERDAYGNPVSPRRRANAEMIEYLTRLKTEKGLPIDVVAYPPSLANIYHVKLFVSDGKRAIVGGMNLSNHSAANWDACVAVEGAEVANIQNDVFHPDWVIARRSSASGLPLANIREELPTIEPVDAPAIKVLNTRPREYDRIGLRGREDIGAYFKDKLRDPNLKSLYSEQFIATHKEIKEMLFKRFEAGTQMRFLHSASVVDQFPYSRKTIFDMMSKGIPVRFYNEWEKTGEKLHAKWTVFNDDEVLIGSANLSARGMETNLETGERPDYPNHEGQRYTRGNRDIALVIRSPKIAAAFKRQFELDWAYSEPKRPAGYGMFEKAIHNKSFNEIERKVWEEKA